MIDRNNEIFPIDEDDTDIMVTLELDDGTEADCEILCIFEVDALKRDYIALLPTGSGEEGEVYLYRYRENPSDGTPILDNIQDDEEFEVVSEAFDAIIEDAEDE